MRIWKLIGVAGLAGVATAIGVAAARRRRTWVEADPDELRARLHARLADGASSESAAPASR